MNNIKEGWKVVLKRDGKLQSPLMGKCPVNYIEGE